MMEVKSGEGQVFMPLLSASIGAPPLQLRGQRTTNHIEELHHEILDIVNRSYLQDTNDAESLGLLAKEKECFSGL